MNNQTSSPTPPQLYEIIKEWAKDHPGYIIDDKTACPPWPVPTERAFEPATIRCGHCDYLLGGIYGDHIWIGGRKMYANVPHFFYTIEKEIEMHNLVDRIKKEIQLFISI